MNAPATVDEFLAKLPADQRAALEDLRGKIRAAAPDAVEVIAYGVPGYRFGGKYLFGFGAAKKHCSFYCGTLLAMLAADLGGYDTAKGTIHFTPDKPLPAALVKRIVATRIADVQKCG